MSQSPPQGKTHYEILGIVRTATPQEVETAFRNMARKWHPDVCEDTHVAAANFKLIITAYEVLADPEKRRHYDQAEARRQGRISTPAPRPRSATRYQHADIVGQWRSTHALDEFRAFADSVFGGRSVGGTVRTSHPELDVQSTLPLAPEEARDGTVVELTLRYGEECPECKTRGAAGQHACNICQGSGRIQQGPRFVKVPIPAGVWNGAVLRVRGEGRRAPERGVVGDLVLRVSVQPLW